MNVRNEAHRACVIPCTRERRVAVSLFSQACASSVVAAAIKEWSKSVFTFHYLSPMKK